MENTTHETVGEVCKAMKFGWLIRGGRSMQKAIDWIAFNDNEGSGDDPKEIAGYMTVCLVADIWNIPRNQLAQAVWSIRALDEKLKPYTVKNSEAKNG